MTCFKACYDLVQKPYNSFTCIIFVRKRLLLTLMGTKLTRELSPDPHTWQLSEDSTTQGRLIVSPSFLISNCCYHGDQVSVCETPAEAGLPEISTRFDTRKLRTSLSIQTFNMCIYFIYILHIPKYLFKQVLCFIFACKQNG